jgi:hypothetical protein
MVEYWWRLDPGDPTGTMPNLEEALSHADFPCRFPVTDSLLILDLCSVTAEVAGSIPVVQAIHAK